MMNEDWINFLREQGAKFSDDRYISEFGGPTAQTETGTCIIMPLLHQGLLEISGPDSVKFMQGQMTCDINTATTDTSQLGAACTPKGRIYTSFRLWQQHNDENPQYLLRMRHDIIESTLSVLGKYIVFFKSKMLDISNDWVGIGIVGKACNTRLEQYFGGLPEQQNQVVQNNQGMLISIPGVRDRYEAWIPQSQAPTLWQLLAEDATPSGMSEWILQDIASGIPEISQATLEEFIPQAINYQAVGGISFTKGCYTGQEIVARTQYRGKSKRFMVRAQLDNAPTLLPGMELADTDSGKNVATLVETAAVSATQQEALLVILDDLSHEEHWKLTYNGQDFTGRRLPLPYSIEEASAED